MALSRRETRPNIGTKTRNELPDLIEFFLKSEHGPGTEVEPPYLVHFQMDRSNVPKALNRAREMLPLIIEHGSFDDERQAAEVAIANALVNNGHMDPQLQQMLGFLLVFLLATSNEGMAAIERGAKKVGYLFSAGSADRRASISKTAAATAGGAIGMMPVHDGAPYVFRLRVVD
jgi:hypothetical protein